MRFFYKLWKWIGYRTIAIRRNYWKYLLTSECKQCEEDIVVVSRSVATNKTTIGSHCAFDNLCVIGAGDCKIGSYCHFGKGVRIITSSHNYKGGGNSI